MADTTYKELYEEWVDEEKKKGLVDVHITHKYMFEDDPEPLDEEEFYESVMDFLTSPKTLLVEI